MPGWLDSLLGAFSSGGGDGSDAFGAVDPNATFDFSGGGNSTDWSSFFGGGDPSSTFDFGSPDLSSFFGDGSTPLNLQTSDPGLTPTGGVDLNGLTPFTAGSNPLAGLVGGGGGGGTPIPLQSIANPLLGATTGSPNNPSLAGLTPATNPLAGLTPGGGGGNPLTNLLGTNGTGVLGTGISLPQLLAAGGGLAGLFTNNGLGPAADSLNTMANSNQDLVNKQILPTALANQQGNLPGPALDAIAHKLGQGQAGIRGAYGGMGESGSTMEQQDLQAANMSARDQAFQESQAMAATGMQEATNLSQVDSGIFQQLMNAQVTQDAALQAAIARVAAAFAGGTPAAAGAGS